MLTGNVSMILSKPEDLAEVRREVAGIARGLGFCKRDVEGMITAVSEACANALTHGRSATERRPKVIINADLKRLEVVVTDWGPGFICPTETPMPTTDSSRGRGIPLMRCFMDDVEFRRGSGCEVVMVKYPPALSCDA